MTIATWTPSTLSNIAGKQSPRGSRAWQRDLDGRWCLIRFVPYGRCGAATICVDGRGLDANACPELLDVLVDLWAEQIEDEPDPRSFTRDIIAETVALDLHYGERGPKIAGGRTMARV